MKILLTAIFKDDSEIKLAERMLDSFMTHFDGLAVALTGTSGNFEKLKKLIKKHKGQYVVTSPDTHPKIYSKKGDKHFFSSFAEARNVSFELASKMQEKDKYDYWSWADVDDILFNGEELKDCAKQAKDKNIDSIFFNYWYSVRVDNKGNIEQVAIEHLRERLLKPDTFKWVSRLHEVAVPKDDNYSPKNSVWDMKEGRKCVWTHLPGEERVIDNLYRNIDILTVQAQEEEYKDPRTVMYLAKTEFDLSRQEEDKKTLHLKAAEDYFIQYLEKSGWAEERAFAWEYMGDIATVRGNKQEAIKRYHKAIAEYAVGHLKYLKLARDYFETGQEELGEQWLNIALNMDSPSSRTTIGNPLDVKLMAAGLKYNQAMKKNDLPEAIKWARTRNKLLGIDKDDEMVKGLLELKENNDMAKNIFFYSKWLKDKGHKKELKALVDTIAPEFKDEAFVQKIVNEAVEPEVWADNTITYFVGQSFEPFTPESLEKKGLGGSETAVVRLSQEWQKMGYKVTVYCNCSEEGEYDGVIYKNWNKINWNDTFNIFIAWRNPGVMDMDIKAKTILYDAHDVESQLNWTPERVATVDKIMVKSEYHRLMLPKVPDDKIEVISNGIL